MLMVVILCNAQEKKDVTKFMGIPVDGTKSEMIQKLEQKGFRVVSDNLLEGEFNGDVMLLIDTYKGKVSNVVVIMGDVTGYNESLAKIAFNSLSQQFERSLKYVTFKSHLIEEDEDISYEMLVNSKRYMNVYLQNGDRMKPVIIGIMIREFSKYNTVIVYSNPYNAPNGEDL